MVIGYNIENSRYAYINNIIYDTKQLLTRYSIIFIRKLNKL